MTRIRTAYFRCLLIAAELVFGTAALRAQSATYYIDTTGGNDANSGRSMASPWQSLQKVNTTTFLPGDSILFKSGGVWNGQLRPLGSGSANGKITIGSYGGTALPRLDGNGQVRDVVVLANQQYWNITNLEITNFKMGDTTIKRGVYVLQRDMGAVRGIRLTNLNIHDVNGDMDLKENGGVYFEIQGSAVPTWFDSLIVEGCIIKDVDRTGLSIESYWATRTLTTNTNWTPSVNVIIRNNWVERTGANGMIVRVSKAPLIEYNTFKQCALKGSGNAFFTFNCDDALVQFNEAYETVYNAGDNDASGFDSDYRCKRSVFQYNYSHDNDDGFLVVCCQGGETRFNDSTIVRYNISQNDGRRQAPDGGIIAVSGQVTNTFIYNNVIYSGPENAFKRVIYHKSWGAYPDKTVYNNNIFSIHRAPVYTFSQSTNNAFDANVFYGIHSATEPADPRKIAFNPLFVNPGSAGVGLSSTVGYKLQAGSPCVNSGLKLGGHAEFDFWGNSVPDSSGIVDRGAFEFRALPAGTGENRGEIERGFHLQQNFPNPFNPVTKIRYDLSSSGHVRLELFALSGERVATLIDGYRLAGKYGAQLDMRDYELSSGVYLYRLSVAEEGAAVPRGASKKLMYIQ